MNIALKASTLIALGSAVCALPVQGGESSSEKKVIINKTDQTLSAYEGQRLVLKSRVSTGREGRRTPNGRFEAKSKEQMHRSRLFHNAPMPYSVQIGGNYFIHGFSSVPDHPASHGCIRLPLTKDNPARKFYEWVEPGTPVEIVGGWGE